MDQQDHRNSDTLTCEILDTSNTLNNFEENNRLDVSAKSHKSHYIRARRSRRELRHKPYALNPFTQTQYPTQISNNLLTCQIFNGSTF
jgi:hypothetical protein